MTITLGKQLDHFCVHIYIYKPTITLPLLRSYKCNKITKLLPQGDEHAYAKVRNLILGSAYPGVMGSFMHVGVKNLPRGKLLRVLAC